MKPITPVLGGFLLLSTGCTFAQFSHHPSAEQVTADFNAIERGMTKQEVVAHLGQPDEGQGQSFIWKEWTDAEHYVRLDVNFDDEGKVLHTHTVALSDVGSTDMTPIPLRPRAQTDTRGL